MQLYIYIHRRKYQYSRNINVQKRKFHLRLLITEPFSEQKFLSKEGRKKERRKERPITKRIRNERVRIDFAFAAKKRMEYHRVSHRCSNASRLRRPDRIRDAFTRLRRRGCTWERGGRLIKFLPASTANHRRSSRATFAVSLFSLFFFFFLQFHSAT